MDAKDKIALLEVKLQELQRRRQFTEAWLQKNHPQVLAGLQAASEKDNQRRADAVMRKMHR